MITSTDNFLHSVFLSVTQICTYSPVCINVVFLLVLCIEIGVVLGGEVPLSELLRGGGKLPPEDLAILTI